MSAHECPPSTSGVAPPRDALTGSSPLIAPSPASAVAGRALAVRRRIGRWLPPMVLLAVLIGIWEVWVLLAHTASYFVPSPGRVGGSFFTSAHLLPRDVWTTTFEALLGLVIGAVAGVTLAAVVATIPLARRVLEPLLVASQTIPIIVLAPLLTVWFGLGIVPKVVVVTLITFFPVAVSTAAGLRDADPEMVDLVRSMGASRRDVLRVVSLPAAIPAFFAGLRIAAAYAVAGAVIGELVASQHGLGVFINESKASYQIDRIFVAVAIIAVLSAVLYSLIGMLARLASPWKHLPTSTLEPA